MRKRGVPAREIRFALDRHLKPLARWLRWLGYDAILLPHSLRARQDQGMLKGRIYITTSLRAYACALKGGKPALLLSPTLDELAQLRDLLALLDLHPHLKFNRCSLCNELLKPAPGAFVEKFVPEAVKRSVGEFLYCPHCQKIFWEGDHVVRIRELFARVQGGRS